MLPEKLLKEKDTLKILLYIPFVLIGIYFIGFVLGVGHALFNKIILLFQ